MPSYASRKSNLNNEEQNETLHDNEKKKRENNHFIFNLFPFQGTEPGSSAYTAKTSQSQRWLIFDEFYHLCLLLKARLMLTELM